MMAGYKKKVVDMKNEQGKVKCVIVEEKNGTGASLWGRLKSGAENARRNWKKRKKKDAKQQKNARKKSRKN